MLSMTEPSYKAKPYTVSFSSYAAEVCIYAYSEEDAQELAKELANCGGAFIFDSANVRIQEVRPWKEGDTDYALNAPWDHDSKLMEAMREADSLMSAQISDRKEFKDGEDERD